MNQDEARRQLLSALEDEASKKRQKQLRHWSGSGKRSWKNQNVSWRCAFTFCFWIHIWKNRQRLGTTSDEMKGKIIGREGRNIRILKLCVALTWSSMTLQKQSSFLVSIPFVELARRTIEKLMEDGRVHPARIEEVVEKHVMNWWSRWKKRRAPRDGARSCEHSSWTY